jgi:hypothetical protein
MGVVGAPPYKACQGCNRAVSADTKRAPGTPPDPANLKPCFFPAPIDDLVAHSKMKPQQVYALLIVLIIVAATAWYYHTKDKPSAPDSATAATHRMIAKAMHRLGASADRTVQVLNGTPWPVYWNVAAPGMPIPPTWPSAAPGEQITATIPQQSGAELDLLTGGAPNQWSAAIWYDANGNPVTYISLPPPGQGTSPLFWQTTAPNSFTLGCSQCS